MVGWCARARPPPPVATCTYHTYSRGKQLETKSGLACPSLVRVRFLVKGGMSSGIRDYKLYFELHVQYCTGGMEKGVWVKSTDCNPPACLGYSIIGCTGTCERRKKGRAKKKKGKRKERDDLPVSDDDDGGPISLCTRVRVQQLRAQLFSPPVACSFLTRRVMCRTTAYM